MLEKQTALGTYLKGLRATRSLSLRDVEKATNNSVSNAYLSQLESGKDIKPSPHILEQLAKAYNVSYTEIMVEAGYIRSTHSRQKNGTAFFNQQDISEEEKRELINYLTFIRKRKKSETG